MIEIRKKSFRKKRKIFLLIYSSMIIPFNKPFSSGNEVKYINDSIKNGHISGDGKYTKKCNNWFKNKYKVDNCLLTHSCTAALEMAAMLCDFDVGSEIIMPSYTFVSTANAFVLQGYIPRFVDISIKNLNIDISKIKEAINHKTKAIVVVHYAGFLLDMDEIMDLAKKHNLLIIEDAAQGFGVKYKNKFLGTIGHFGCISFHETKNIISGEGGALFVNDKRYMQRAEIIREKGTNRKNFYDGIVDKYSWVDKGSSFLPSDILAAYLFAQLESSESINKKRKIIYDKYYSSLKNILSKYDIRFPNSFEKFDGNAHIFYLIFKNKNFRDDFMSKMKKEALIVYFIMFLYILLNSLRIVNMTFQITLIQILFRNV